MSNVFNKLVGSLKSLQEPARDGIVFGTVVTVSPLSINVGEGIVLPAEFFWLGQMCRPHKVTIPHTHLMRSFSLGQHNHAYSEDTETAGDHEHKYGGDTGKNGLHGHNNDPHRHLLKPENAYVGMEGWTEYNADESTGISSDGEHSHSYSGIAVINGSHKHRYAGNVGNTEIGFTASAQHRISSDTVSEDCVVLEIHPKLKPGDVVVLLPFNDGQLYYVAERIEP